MIKDWIQYPAGVGVHYPTSGQLVGHAAEFLRLKGYLRPRWQGRAYKTAQRHFEGTRIEFENVDLLIDTLVASVLPPAGVGGIDVSVTGGWVRRFIGNALRHWDVLVGSLLGPGFPMFDARVAPLPFLRLFVLDAAIRWAAVQDLVTPAGAEPNLRPDALERDGLRRAIDGLRQAPVGRTLTLGALAEAAKVSGNTLDAWRSGDAFPTDENLKFLAAPLAQHVGRPPESVEFDLRVAVGLGALRRFLDDLCGEVPIADLVDTFEKVAHLTHRWLRFADIPDERLSDVMHEIVEDGARASNCGGVIKYLSESSERHAEVQADILALPGRWDARLNYWAKVLTAFEKTAGFLNHLPGISDEEKQRLRPEIEERVFRMRFFDEEDAAHPHLYRAPADANTKAKIAAIAGHRARSYGDIETAARCLREATQHDPSNAAYHYDAGCYLGELVARGQIQHLDEALAECRLAARFDPTWNSPLTEVALILSNVGMFEEALRAFEQAEAVGKDWDHFHFTRGNTLLWTGSFDEAEISFRRALKIAPQHLKAKVNLAVALTCLGRHGEVARLAPEVAHQGGPRCTSPEEDWLAVFPRMSLLAQRLWRGAQTELGIGMQPRTPAKQSSKIGRNEACPLWQWPEVQEVLWAFGWIRRGIGP